MRAHAVSERVPTDISDPGGVGVTARAGAISGQLCSLPKISGLPQHIPIVTGSPRAAAWLP